jgi:polyhydroxyalkanoate synthesis regulator phasin
MSNMSDKLQESLQYLKQYSIIENEAIKLYETLSKKINQPESSFILGIACDSLKNTKIIQGILDCFDMPELENKIARKDLSELVEEIIALEKKISKINSLDYLVSSEILKESIELEVALGKVYTNYLESNSARIIVDELAKTGMISLANFKKIIEYLIEEKGKHREIIVETKYILDAKETENRRQIIPLIKYQNPDGWIRESTIHAFVNPPENNLP